MALAFAETVTITRQITDSHGDHTDGASHTQGGCAVWPTTSTETVFGQDTVVWGLTVLMPPGADVLSTDTVIVRGVTYLVNGEPSLYKSPLTGAEAGIEVLLKTESG